MIDWDKTTMDIHEGANATLKRLEDEAGFIFDDRCSALMDLEACHISGTPLDWDALADGDVQDVAHDVFGIIHHIDRDTGRLGDCFSPRFAKPKTDIQDQVIAKLERRGFRFASRLSDGEVVMQRRVKFGRPQTSNMKEKDDEDNP